MAGSRTRLAGFRPGVTAIRELPGGTPRALTALMHASYTRTSCWLAAVALAARRPRDAESYFLGAVIFATDGAKFPVVSSAPLLVRYGGPAAERSSR